MVVVKGLTLVFYILILLVFPNFVLRKSYWKLMLENKCFILFKDVNADSFLVATVRNNLHVRYLSAFKPGHS